MIEVHLCGGLGNQMFQYAIGRTVSLRLNVPLCLNISWFANISRRQAHEAWRLPLFPYVASQVAYVNSAPQFRFQILLRRINNIIIRFLHIDIAQKFLPKPLRLISSIIIEPYYNQFWPGIENIPSPCHLYGFWQSEKYFSQHAEQIRKDFAFSALPDGRPQALAERIKSCSNAVSVHIRRGDYIKTGFATTGTEYYRSALEHIRAFAGETTIFAFSDEPQWVRDNFDACGHTLEVVDLNLPDSPQHDMHLMALCRHHVVANSSFSWWGAWLGEHGGITIAPSRWLPDPKINTDDICPKRWLRI